MPYAVITYANGQTGYRAINDAMDLAEGEIYADAPLPLTLADVSAALIPDVQRWLDGTAQANGYDSLFTCISYLNSGVQQYAGDAAIALAWRDAVWPACFQWQQDAIANPPVTFPTSAEVIALLPQPEAFGWVIHQPGATA